MDSANSNQDSQFKMGKDKKKKKKGKLRRALKNVFGCLFPWASSTSKASSKDDVYEPSTSKTQTASTPSSSETRKVSESSPTKTQKTKKPGLMARLKAKMSKSQSKVSSKTDSTVPAPPKLPTVLGGAAMISGSETSDEVFLPAAQNYREILEEYFVLERMQAPSFISVETFYSYEEDDLFYGSEYLDYELEDESGDEEQSKSTPASIMYSAGALRDFCRTPALSVYDNVEKENLDNLTQEEIMQLIHCTTTEPPKHQQVNDYEGQDQSVKYMGFPNIGNTCYMNSTLQCFLSIPPIVKDIILQENAWKNGPGSEMHRAFYDLHLARLNKTQNIPTNLLAGVKDRIAMWNPDFEGDDQQDAHEFFITLLAQLKDEAAMCQQAEKTFRNPVAHLEFRVNRMRTCETCGNQSCTTEEVNCLSLVIGPQKSLIESLQQYFATSQLEWCCDKCHGTQASESVEIQTLPRVLVILVMRFDMFTARKVKGRLAVPEELSLASFTGSDSCEQAADLYSKEARKQQQADATYKLSGVVSHYGSSLHCGHFVSNIRDPCGPEWLKCDDESVKSVTWDAHPEVTRINADSSLDTACYEDFR